MNEPDKSIEDLARKLELGATGEFPEGKLTEDDEGEIKIGVTAKDGQVIIAFGKPVTWIGLPPQLARQLADSIRKQSYRV